MSGEGIRPFRFTRIEPPEQEQCEKGDEALQKAVHAAEKMGFERGYAAGAAEAECRWTRMLERERQAAFEEGRSRGRHDIASLSAALSEAISQYRKRLEAAEGEIESFAIELSLAVIRKILGKRNSRGEFIRRIVREGLSAVSPLKPSRILLNPGDIELYEEKHGLNVEADASLAPGDVRIDAGRLFASGSLEEAIEEMRKSILHASLSRGSVNRPANADNAES